MASLKASDVTRGATLLKRLVDRADTNLDGAIRTGEVDSIAPPNPRLPRTRRQNDLRSALDGVRRYSIAKGSAKVTDLKKTVDLFARRLKATDANKDGQLSDTERKSLSTMGERRFADFVAHQAGAKVSDFKLAPQRTPQAPRFSWKGTPAQVTSSLLQAFSDSKNDNFWPRWGSPGKGAARYVLTRAEANKMVKALEPLYATRQQAVIAELASRTQASEFGCVSCDAGARAVFAAYAGRLGVAGLTFGSPSAPKMPAP
jgi:hypothetical protein